MIVVAPTNCGFIVPNDGWVRLWLTDDPAASSGRDLWVRRGEFYHLSVAQYELDTPAAPTPEALTFDESTRLGGYTSSLVLDEMPYSNLPANVGFYVGYEEFDSNLFRVKRRGASDFVEVSLASGDFYAGDVEAVEQTREPTLHYLFLVLV